MTTSCPTPIVQSSAADLPGATDLSTPIADPPQEYRPPAPDLLFTIRVLGNLLDDLERVRIMNSNRIGAMERELGFSTPGLQIAQQSLRAIEHECELELCRVWRKHPLAPWAKTYRGLGEKSIARLIAVIGDPATRIEGHTTYDTQDATALEGHSIHDTQSGFALELERTVSQLWAYCGHGDPARSYKRKGMTQEELFKQGSPRAKKQVWLISTSLLKAGNREVYDATRAKYAEARHEKACPRCGPGGHPALPGSALSDGHKHARALRAVGKAFLKDLWIASRQSRTETQAPDGEQAA